MTPSGIPPEPEDVRALRVDDDWWPRPPKSGPFRHTVGVRPGDAARWLRPGPFDEVLRRWQNDVLDVVGDAAFVALPGSEQAGQEALALVTRAAGDRDVVGGAHPLDRAARHVVEDLCLVDVSGPDPVLIAASVVMPNRWRLADKLGHNLVGVHAPVPGYAEEIGTATDRLMRRLAGDRIMARASWAITDRPDLFQPAHSSRVEQARPDVRTGEQAADALFIRVEYQTVRALPESAAVLFTIHTAREPLSALARRPAVANTMLAVLDGQSQEHHRYKGVAPYLGPLRECLRSFAA